MPSASFRLVPTLALAAPLLALAACGSESDTLENAAERGEPTAPSSEWIEANPTEPAVPVTLPTTPMTNVPPAPAPS